MLIPFRQYKDRGKDMGLIHLLDTEVSNKIAAGEVVERPLSIVKELVENSIDAGAETITVEIRGGGITYIRVTDNGCGMSAEDAKICFLRHATSKITTGSDLDAIYTLGFRGEALSSIGAVAKIKLYTKRRCDDMGVCVTCEGGEILSSDYAGAPNGTVIEVTDLFYNTPARRKFLKKPATEAGYISDIMSRLVFAHPEISFKLVRDGKEIIFSPGDSKLISAVYAVYGKDYAKNMLDVDFEFNGIRVSGLVGKGTLARANRNYETFFVNRRYIKSPIMIRALEEAYKNQIMISKFPTAILNIEVEASDVDINVHPTKLECKFSNEHDIYQTVYHAVKQTLYALPNVPEIERAATEKKAEPQRIERGEQRTLEQIYKEELRKSIKPDNNFKYSTSPRVQIGNIAKNAPEADRTVYQSEKTAIFRNDALRNDNVPERVPAMTPDQLDDIATVNGNTEDQPKAEYEIKPEEKPMTEPELSQVVERDQQVSDERSEEVDTFAMLDFAAKRPKGRGTGKVTVNEAGAPQKENPGDWDWEKYRDKANEEYKEKTPGVFEGDDFRVIGQLFETYILVEKDDRLLMIDQHAAHERLNYEKLKAELEERAVCSQMLMDPVVVNLSGEEFASFGGHEKMFDELGFGAEIYGESSVIIRSVPVGVSWSEAEPLFIELLTQLTEMRNEVISDSAQRLLYTISCKASIKANMKIGIEEMRQLVRRVFELENINTCPHGRPIVISMSKKEIEKDFKRIV